MLPPDTPVFRFAGGRVTIWKDLQPGLQGTYRFDGAARPPVLVVIWPHDWRNEPPPVYRFRYQFLDDTMAWCCDTRKPDKAPPRFAADTTSLYITTFRRLK
jgi:hypothetical protein